MDGLNKHLSPGRPVFVFHEKPEANQPGPVVLVRSQRQHCDCCVSDFINVTMEKSTVCLNDMQRKL